MEILLSTHICAYLDVLGGTDLFKCVDMEASETFVSMLLELERRLNGMRRDGTPVVRAFTDNVFIAYPLRTTGKYSIEQQVVAFLTEVGNQLEQILIHCELPMRGAITVGQLHIDDRAIIGEALVRAVELEKVAKAPRVLLDDDVIKLLPTMPLARDTYVYEAADGRKSLNYLGLRFWGLKYHRELIERKIEEVAGNAGVQEKYKWLLNYHSDIERRIAELGLIPGKQSPDQ
jgi:hypothetical protein